MKYWTLYFILNNLLWIAIYLYCGIYIEERFLYILYNNIYNSFRFKYLIKFINLLLYMHLRRRKRIYSNDNHSTLILYLSSNIAYKIIHIYVMYIIFSIYREILLIINILKLNKNVRCIRVTTTRQQIYIYTKVILIYREKIYQKP